MVCIIWSDHHNARSTVSGFMELLNFTWGRGGGGGGEVNKHTHTQTHKHTHMHTNTHTHQEAVVKQELTPAYSSTLWVELPGSAPTPLGERLEEK